MLSQKQKPHCQKEKNKTMKQTSKNLKKTPMIAANGVKMPMVGGKPNWLKVTYDEPDNKKLKKLYVGWAEVYDKNMVEWGYSYNRYVVKLFPKMKVKKNAKILDAGGGSGWVGQSLFDIGYRNLINIDYSPEMLKEAKKKKIYKKNICADLKKPIKMRTNSIDAIMSVGFLARGHLGTECLDEFYRILKPGGYHICSIGENVFKKFGFDKKIKQLIDDGIVTVDHKTRPFTVLPNNKASAKSRMWCIRKL